MPINIKTDDDNSTLTWSITALTTKIMDRLDKAARYFYPIRYQLYEEVEEEQTLIPYDDLTNEQKLAIIDKELLLHLNNGANAYNSNTKVADAQLEAASENESNKL